jgi:hypothetical protein
VTAATPADPPAPVYCRPRAIHLAGSSSGSNPSLA